MDDYWSKYSPAPQPGAAKGGAVAKKGYQPTPDDKKVLTDLAKALPTMRTLSERAQESLAIQRGTGRDDAIPSGPALAKWDFHGMDLNPVRGAVSLAGVVSPKARDMADRLQRMDQINSETFAMIRPEGSGRILQSEVGPFKQSFPAAGAYGTNNERSARQFADEYRDQLARYQFVRNYLDSGQGSAADALAEYDARKGAPVGQGRPAAPAAQPTPREQLNATLKARSAAMRQAPQPVAAGAVVDIFGRPVQ